MARTQPDQPSPPLCVPPVLQLALEFDSVILERDLGKLPDALWRSHFNPSDYIGDWRVVALRSPTGKADFVRPMQAPCEALLTTEAGRACPNLDRVVASFQCSLRAARLSWLGPGASIRTHTDPHLDFSSGVVRLHIPIRSHAGVQTEFDGRSVDMRSGECWYADFSRPHSVDNRSTHPRVHLVLDCEVDSWLASIFARSMAESSSVIRSRPA